MSPTTLVTGASRGIGRAICDRLAALGQNVVGIARAPDTSFPGQLFVADLGDEAATSNVLREILASERIDNLVNNAGVSHICRLEALAMADLRTSLEINLRAPAQIAQACLPAMAARGGGRVVNIGSRAQRGRRGVSAYAAAKAGLEAMTVTWALEYARDNITVNLVAPGAIETSMFAHNNPVGSDHRDALLSAVPMGRPGRPEEIGAAVAFFLSDEASYITGQTLFVCGGWSVSTP